MIEVKARLKAIRRIIGAKKPHTLSIDFDNEAAMLQVRKVIELVTFSAIVADEGRYRQLRVHDREEEPKDHGDYSLDWNAPDILKRMAKISPHFLPRPLGSTTTGPDGVVAIGDTRVKVTHDRLVEIYKTTGGYLHAPNPYREDFVLAQERRLSGARDFLNKEVAWLESVLWTHGKIGLAWNEGGEPETMDQPESAWLVFFGDKSSPEVRMTMAKAVGVGG
jgi:hypothetical protein